MSKQWKRNRSCHTAYTKTCYYIEQGCPTGGLWYLYSLQGVNVASGLLSSHCCPYCTGCSSSWGLRAFLPFPRFCCMFLPQGQCQVSGQPGASMQHGATRKPAENHLCSWCSRGGAPTHMHVHGVCCLGGPWLPLVLSSWCVKPVDHIVPSHFELGQPWHRKRNGSKAEVPVPA